MLFARFAFLALAALGAAPSAAPAQTPAASAQESQVVIPGFWDPRRRVERVDMTRVPQIRFLTEDDFPPFNYAGPDGQPVGFNIDLARALCEELRVPCTMQVRRWDTLLDSLDRNAGDAVIASMVITPDIRRRYEVSDRYFETPARFAARKEAMPAGPLPEAIAGRTVAVVAGSAHEAYATAHFRQATLRPFGSIAEARRALRAGEVDVLFADAVGLAFWMNGTTSADCCRFLPGAYNDSRYFGEGMAIVMRRGNDQLRLAVNNALIRLWERGIYADIYLRNFPIGVY